VSYQRERYEKWISEFLQPRYPNHVSQFRAALDTYESAVTSGSLTQDGLQTIAECIRSRTRSVAENVATLLGELAARYPQAALLIKELAQDAKQNVRLNALVALAASPAGTLHADVLRPALKDRSSRVRVLAADQIARSDLTDLMTDLEEAVDRELDQETKESLACDRDLLRDGFYTRRHDADQFWVTCRLPDGGLKSALVTQAEVDARGLTNIARNLAAQSIFRKNE
jgi:hypothetical protein